MKKFISNYLHSIQSRITAFIIILSVILSANSYVVYINQLDIKHVINHNAKIREIVLDNKDRVQSDLLESYKLLDTFLLDPNNKVVQQWILETLNHAIENTEKIVASEWVLSRNKSRTPVILLQSLFNLNKEIINLTDVRKDPNRQYPSLNIASASMRPNRVSFISSINIAIDEIKNEEENFNIHLYNEILDIRYHWSQLLSNFRIYLANQFGAFDTAILTRQEAEIKTQYNYLSDLLNKFKRHDEEGNIGLQTVDALENMSASLDKWYNAFLEIEVIHHSDSWRVDLSILKNQIQPSLDEITYILGLLNEEIKASENEDKNVIDKIISDQTKFLHTVSIIIILILSLLLYVLKLVVFRPISHVTEAINAETFGQEEQDLPEASSSEANNLITAFSEMRHQIHLRQQDLSYQANHDSLTGLPNRKFFQQKMSEYLDSAKRDNCKLAVLLIDLNGFKDINDTLGHHIGDQLLIKVGNRLRSILEDHDVVARLGGDEFAILMPDTNKQSAKAELDKIKKSIDEKFTIEGVNTFIGMSIGVALYPDHGEDSNALLRHSDVAMYIAKHQKKPYVFYKSTDDNYTLNRLSLIHDIKNSINHDGLILYFQPKLRLDNLELNSFEALVRWDHPELGMVMPAEFIPIAEQTGFINQITYWVIEESLIKCSRWIEEGLNIKIAVNLSVYNLFDADFIEIVQSLLNKYEKVSKNLIFEITESAMMTNPTLAISNLNKLRTLGIKLSIDDYGTGFSSLSYLSQLSVDELKIDKSFISDMINDDRKAIIVKSTIEMAHSLDLEVVAEGVETEEVLNRLKTYGCNIIQGYLISKPLPESDLSLWLDTYQEELKQVLK